MLERVVREPLDDILLALFQTENTAIQPEVHSLIEQAMCGAYLRLLWKNRYKHILQTVSISMQCQPDILLCF